VEEEEPEAAMSFVGVVVGFGEEGSAVRPAVKTVVAQCSGGGTSRRWLRPSRCDRELGFSVGIAAHSEPRTESRWPPPLFIAQCDGGLLVIDGFGAPDQGARSRPKQPLGHCDWEINPTTPSISNYMAQFGTREFFLVPAFSCENELISVKFLRNFL
jgi:hypothetical protein